MTSQRLNENKWRMVRSVVMGTNKEILKEQDEKIKRNLLIQRQQEQKRMLADLRNSQANNRMVDSVARNQRQSSVGRNVEPQFPQSIQADMMSHSPTQQRFSDCESYAVNPNILNAIASSYRSMYEGAVPTPELARKNNINMKTASMDANHPSEEEQLLAKKHISHIRRMAQSGSLTPRVAFHRWAKGSKHSPQMVRLVGRGMRVLEEDIASYVNVMPEYDTDGLVNQGLSAEGSYTSNTAGYKRSVTPPNLINSPSTPPAKPETDIGNPVHYVGGPPERQMGEDRLTSDARGDDLIRQQLRNSQRTASDQYKATEKEIRAKGGQRGYEEFRKDTKQRARQEKRSKEVVNESFAGDNPFQSVAQRRFNNQADDLHERLMKGAMKDLSTHNRHSMAPRPDTVIPKAQKPRRLMIQDPMPGCE